MPKYNNNSQFYKDWTTKKLKDEAKSLDQMIYEVECYGTNDLRQLNAILTELHKRGIEPINKLMFK